MGRVTFIRPGGQSVEVNVENGTSLMRAAIANGVNEIIGDCGGTMSCATCHVLVEERFLDRLDPQDPAEDEMLDFAAMERRPNSRLACQITMRDDLDDMTVVIADPQL